VSETNDSIQKVQVSAREKQTSRAWLIVKWFTLHCRFLSSILLLNVLKFVAKYNSLKKLSYELYKRGKRMCVLCECLSDWLHKLAPTGLSRFYV